MDSNKASGFMSCKGGKAGCFAFFNDGMIPLQTREPSKNGGLLAPYPAHAGEQHILLFPRCVFISAKGDTMTFLEVAGLFSLIGGTIVATFTITWPIANKDNKKK